MVIVYYLFSFYKYMSTDNSSSFSSTGVITGTNVTDSYISTKNIIYIIVLLTFCFLIYNYISSDVVYVNSTTDTIYDSSDDTNHPTTNNDYRMTVIFGQKSLDMQQKKQIDINNNDNRENIGLDSVTAVLNFGQEIGIFRGGNREQPDKLFTHDLISGELVDVIDETLSSDESTYSALAIDLNNDGYTDLFVIRDSGIYLFKNNKDSTFTKQIILKSTSYDYGPVSCIIHNPNTNDIYVTDKTNTFIYSDEYGFPVSNYKNVKHYQLSLNSVGNTNLINIVDHINNNQININQINNNQINEPFILMDLEDGLIQSNKYVNPYDNYIIHSQPTLIKQIKELNNFINIMFPLHPKYFKSQVILNANKKTHVQIYDKNNMIRFELGNIKHIDNIRIRTNYGEDIKIDRPQINTTVNV
jgi:hypothetical protein